MNAIIISATAEHLVNNQSCAENFNLNRFNILKRIFNLYSYLKVEALYILIKNCTLYMHRV